MTRFVPPHLMVLVVFLIGVLWVMFVRHFRQSSAMQKFVAETFGDDTPESALRMFEAARHRLADHLNDHGLDPQMREQIESALGFSPNNQRGEEHGIT